MLTKLSLVILFCGVCLTGCKPPQPAVATTPKSHGEVSDYKLDLTPTENGENYVE